MVHFDSCGLTRLQLSAYRGNSGITAMMKSSAMKLAEQDELTVKSLDIPYTIIRTGVLTDTPGGTEGFCFEEVRHNLGFA